MENAANKLNEVQRESWVTIKNKASYVLAENVSLQNLKTIRDILLNKNVNTSLNIEFKLSNVSSMKYAPLSSVEVERSFSRYKSILRPNRRTFEIKNVQMYVVSNCFQEGNIEN